MATLNQIVSMLQEQRRELLEQLSAVDRALAALEGGEAAAPATLPAAPAVVDAPAEAREVLPRRVTARRVMTDPHREAVIAGKRRARNVREAAKGLARELPDEGFVPAIRRRGDDQAPRLVKRSITK